MKALLDTNVVLDVLLARKPWVSDSKAVWDACDDGRIDGYITATTITTIAYITERTAGKVAAKKSIRICLDAFTLCTVDLTVLELAYTLSGDDFEDNLQIACATTANLDAIITRDKSG